MSITCSKEGAFLLDGKELISLSDQQKLEQLGGRRKIDRTDGRKGTIAWEILQKHNLSENPESLKIRFDAMASHDITYVGIVQTARASGMDHFPLPYVLTNCHNSLCAVGGTINEDDHLFGLSAAKKYGGIYVPPHLAVIHQFMREEFAGCGKMILGSDSHTRYGALGTIAIGEGGGELVKQLLEDTYDLPYPEVIAVYLEGEPEKYVGPQDVALAIIGAVYKSGYVKNKIMEFVGPGIEHLAADYRNGIDVMTTETTCLSSIWQTDAETKNFLSMHNRSEEYQELRPKAVAYYDGVVRVDLGKIRPMIALPFHPSRTYAIDELNANLPDILRAVEKDAEEITEGQAGYTLTDKITDRGLQVQQAVIAGCAGGLYSNITEAAAALKGHSIGNDAFSLSVYPASQSVSIYLSRAGISADLMESGAVCRSAFCGPCFGAGDTPANNSLSIRHATRNFPNREGSKPGNGQMSGVALMDARSIAATCVNGGILTSAEELDVWGNIPEYTYDGRIYQSRVFYGYGKAEPETGLILGPNIKDWPEMPSLKDVLLLKVASKILDPVTTTDELIPSGETSSYRSNPLKLAEYTLSRRDPGYVGRAKAIAKEEQERQVKGEISPAYQKALELLLKEAGLSGLSLSDIQIGSTIYAKKPGDGSAREQAASCQRVLGATANLTSEYATKRYRSNVINWGMLPFQMKEEPAFSVGDFLLIPGIREALKENRLEDLMAYVLTDGQVKRISLYIAPLNEKERSIILAGSLINYNRNARERV